MKLNLENPTLPFLEKVHIIAERWKFLSKEEKNKFEEIAKHDRIRYDAEMDTYQQVKFLFFFEKIFNIKL